MNGWHESILIPIGVNRVWIYRATSISYNRQEGAFFVYPQRSAVRLHGNPEPWINFSIKLMTLITLGLSSFKIVY